MAGRGDQPDQPSNEPSPSGASAPSPRALKVLCVVLAVFAVAGGVSGLLGLRNSLRVLQEAAQIERARKAIDEDVAAVHALKQHLTAASEETLQEVRQAIPEALEQAEAKFESRIKGLESGLNAAIVEVREKADTELGKVGERLDREMANFAEKLRQQRFEDENYDRRRSAAVCRDLSVLFREAGAANAGALTPREKLLLTLLAAEMDPGNADLVLDAAEQAYRVGNHSRATALLAKVLSQHDLDSEVARKARALQQQVEEADRREIMLEHQNPGRVRVGPYGVFDLHLNTLLTLVRNGYLTPEQAQQILDDSKKRPEEEPAPEAGLTVGPTRYVPVK